MKKRIKRAERPTMEALANRARMVLAVLEGLDGSDRDGVLRAALELSRARRLFIDS